MKISEEKLKLAADTVRCLCADMVEKANSGHPGAALGMAVFCTLLGHSVFSWGLKYLPPAFIATVKLMEPVFASVWGLILFAEKPAVPVLIGGAVIICGIALYSRVADET